MVEILDLDFRASRDWNQFPQVALLTRQGLVLTFEGHAGFGRVIETFTLQPDEGEFFAVMIRMAPRAVRFAGGTLVFVRMKTRMSIQSAPDFNVTLKALEAAVSGARSKIVT
jgi:hypothetical protein